MLLRFARPSRACMALFLLTASLLAWQGWAQEPTSESSSASEPTGELTLAGAIEVALDRNPDLAASAYEIRAARARILQTGLRPNPTLSADLETLLRAALPQAGTALAQTQSGYERSRFSFLELSTAQQDLLALREAAIAAATDYHQARTEIERLTSEPLSPGLPE